MPMRIGIPLLNEPRQSLTVLLDTQEVRLEVWRQPSDSHWYASVWHPIETLVRAGHKLLPYRPVFARVPRELRGDLVVLPIAGADSDRLGTTPWELTHRLVWTDEGYDSLVAELMASVQTRDQG